MLSPRNDLLELAELQADLAFLDGRETARNAAVPLGLILLSLAVLSASVTVCLLGSAWLLASFMGIQQAWAMLATAGVATVLASLALGLGVTRSRSSFTAFRASREELRRNLTWLRSVLISRQDAVPGKGN